MKCSIIEIEDSIALSLVFANFSGRNFVEVADAVLDRRPKFYGRSRRFNTYGYGGRSLRPFLRPKVLFVVFLVFFKIEAGMQAFLCFHYTGGTCLQIRLIWIIPQDFFYEILNGKVIEFKLCQIEHKVMNSCLHKIHQFSLNDC